MRVLNNHRNPASADPFLSTIIMTLAIAAFSGANAADMRNISTTALVRDMGLGINLGNTLESACDWDDADCWIDPSGSGGVNAFETAWGSPTITKAMIDGYAAGGIKTLRIPVAWSNLMTGNSTGGSYTVSAALLDRVQQIVDYARGNGMYAIVNIHWDGGWWKKFPTDSAECMKKYTRVWTQISERFKNYDDYLVFESLNEEGAWDDVWYVWRNESDFAAKTRVYGLLNAINQTFTNIVRASGGNNAERHLLIAGYATNIDRTCDTLFKMPSDPKNRQAVSAHYYDPFGFSHNEDWVNWEPLRPTWGTSDDSAHLKTEMDKMKTRFVDRGIPVIIGEYGFASKSYEQTNNSIKPTVAEIRKYTLAVAEAVYSRGMCPVLWDVQQSETPNYYYDRNTRAFTDPQLVSGFKAIAGENVPTAVNHKSARGGAKQKHPRLTVRGETLTVSLSTNSSAAIRIIDVRGKVRASFKAVGAGSFDIGKIPAGRYWVEVRDGRNAATAVLSKLR